MFREALIIEALLIKAQVSPRAAQNSLRGLSAQAILMGIPFPHALGCPTQVGWSAANAPFRKPTGGLLSSGDVMHHSRISSWAFYLQYHVLHFFTGQELLAGYFIRTGKSRESKWVDRRKIHTNSTATRLQFV